MSRPAGELWDLLKTGRRFRALGRTDGFRLLRWAADGGSGPRGRVVSSRICCRRQSRRAASSARRKDRGRPAPAAVLLLNAAVDPAPGGSSVTVKGGPGALTPAMASAAREAGAEIRTGAGVSHVFVVEDGRGARRRPRRTEPRFSATAVISNADPRADVPRARRSGGARSGLSDQGAQLPQRRDGGEGESRAQ